MLLKQHLQQYMAPVSCFTKELKNFKPIVIENLQKFVKYTKSERKEKTLTEFVCCIKLFICKKFKI